MVAQRVALDNTEVTAIRRSIVAELSRAGVKPAVISATLAEKGILNPRTGKPFTRQVIRADMQAYKKATEPRDVRYENGFKVYRRPVSETIGQWSMVKPNWNARVLLNMDTTTKDYVFWDALRRGTAAGYEISGPAFCLPAAQTIASYCFGKGITAALVESAIPAAENKRSVNEAALVSEANGKPTQNKRNAMNSGQGNQGKVSPLNVLPKPKPILGPTDKVAWTNLQLKRMLEGNQGFLLTETIDEFCLGNQYVICNPDCTFSVASPETVMVEYSTSDYRHMLRVIITTKMEGARVQDTYTADKRTITVQYYDERGTKEYEFENLIGRIPIVHFANDRSANEIYGRPIYEAGLPIMWRYDQLINNILEGVTLLGTPIPMFTNLDDPTGTKIANSDAVTYTDEEGNEQTQYVMRLDRQTGIFLGKGGDGKMLSTNVGFTKDSIDSLHQLKLLWLNQTHIPEFIMGGAIASSKASTETQMPPFIQYINFRRLLLEGQGAEPSLGIPAKGGLLELIDIWLRTYKLLNPDIVVAPVQIEWPEIDFMNDQMKYMWGSFLAGLGYITPEATVKMSGYIADPVTEVMKAAGKKARAPEYDNYDEQLRKARLERARASIQPLDDDGRPYKTDYTPVEIDMLKGRNGYATNGGVGGINSVAAHQHAEGEAMGNEWSIDSPLSWIGMLNWDGG